MIRLINKKITSTRGFDHLYNFTSRYALINGHTLHYLDQGEGKPVLMVHGNPTWSFYFRNLVTQLSGQYRTIAPDHMGCGFSDKPDTNRYDYTLASRVKDLEALVEHLNLTEKITLVVHDWGGMIGLAFALAHLDRIEKIIITNTSGFLLPRNKRFPLRLGLIKYLKPLAVPAVLGLNLFSRCALFMAASTKLGTDVKTGLTAPYNSWKNRIATLKFVEDIPLGPKDPSYSLVKGVDDNLSKLAGIPMLILWGKQDFVFDEAFLDEWKARFPHARVHLFEDAGHYLFEDKPRKTAELIEKFLKAPS
ncbi:MAG TPA: alpha/beta fold hydrolase [Desulfobacteraceae bacterium]|nr:alpha/beta fold hydrolase [Desulfobacteraceae bacterium]